ncbi:MAG TPA: hypothetical protein VG077_15150 [Verrucomicrobiae bacterium]|nr:hypothetical protein [Verrucomicrobiae bacterium]
MAARTSQRRAAPLCLSCSGFQYYLVPEDGGDNPLTPPGNTVNFAAG